MYIAPGLGQTTERLYHFDHLLEIQKQFLSTLILYIFLNYFTYVYRVQGQTNPWGQNFDVNRKAFVILTICCKF